jgi:hypothetical protein
MSSKKWNETRPQQNIRSANLLNAIQVTGQGEININNERQFTGEISGGIVGTASDLLPKQNEKDLIGFQPIQVNDVGNALTQESRQELGSLSKTETITDLVLTTPTRAPTPIITPITPHIRIPYLPGKPKKEETKSLYEKQKKQRFFSKTKKKQKKGLPPDLLSVTQSHARHGTATQPKLTKELFRQSEKTLFMRTPTKELQTEGKNKGLNLLGNKNKKGGKKNVKYY